MSIIKGIVQSGGTGADIRPIGGAQVSLLEVTGGAPNLVGNAVTDASGAFSIETARTGSDTIFYLRADAGGAILLMAILGPELMDAATVNELTTVSAVYCAAQFIDGAQIAGDAAGVRVAAGMSANLVTIATGASSPVLTASPNADETNALRSTRSLANLLAMCVRDPGTAWTNRLFDLTTPPGGPRPSNTIGAMYNIARYPANRVAELYSLSQAVLLYQPPLERQPDAWTLAVKVNDSGDDAHLFGGPANLVFDRYGRAWITNNVVQGTPDSTEWSMVLGPEGRPAVDGRGNRISPFTGGGLLGAGFGVAIDSQDRVWIGNFGWGEVYPAEGGLSVFSLDAVALSPPPDGYTADSYRVQGTVVDNSDNVWLASYGNSRVVVYPGGDTLSPICYQGVPAGDPGEGVEEREETFLPFGVAIAADGTAWVSNSNTIASTICQFQLSGGKLQLLQEIAVGQTIKGIAIDSIGTIWVGSGGDTYVYAFQPDGALIGGFRGGGLDGPWGVGIDGDDQLWAANFGPLHEGPDFHGRLTCFAGANLATRPAGANVGDPLTPESGYTLPSAGSPVLLHNGDPLYGAGSDPCLIPMMRTTGLNFDAAGNVWTCNNWKPNYSTDRESNPGGDGIVIFIGLAKPPRHDASARSRRSAHRGG